MATLLPHPGAGAGASAAAAAASAGAPAPGTAVTAVSPDAPGSGTAPSVGGSAGSAAGTPYKRASRKGAPRRFSCDHPGCDKLYSRAEHLQRHQLNRKPSAGERRSFQIRPGRG